MGVSFLLDVTQSNGMRTNLEVDDSSKLTIADVKQTLSNTMNGTPPVYEITLLVSLIIFEEAGPQARQARGHYQGLDKAWKNPNAHDVYGNRLLLRPSRHLVRNTHQIRVVATRNGKCCSTYRVPPVLLDGLLHAFDAFACACQSGWDSCCGDP